MSLNPLLAMQQRVQRIRDRLAAAPLVEWHGVVGPSGVGASRMQGETDWSLTFRSPAWRIDEGLVSRDSMTIRFSVANEEIDPWRARLPPLAIVRLRARCFTDADLGGGHALLVDLLAAPTPDAELAAIALALSQPVVIDDPVLGVLTLDRRVNTFDGEAMFMGRPVRVRMDADDRDDASAALAQAHAVWREADRWHREAIACAARELLETKNDSWLDEAEPELDEAAFIARLALETISVNDDGDLEFWFADGGLFTGHSILVSGSREDGFDAAQIAG